MKSKTLSFIFLISAASFAFVFLLLLYLSVPFMLWHKAFFCSANFDGDMRYNDAGIIRQASFDSVILGTSNLINTSSNETSAKLGGKFVNLSMNGAFLSERSIILKYLLEQKNIKKLIISLDRGIIDSKDNGNPKKPQNEWAFLYDFNDFNDIKVYLDFNNLALVFKNFKNGLNYNCKDFDRPGAWHEDPEFKAAFGGLQNWAQNSNRAYMRVNLQEVLSSNEKSKKEFDIKLFEIIKNDIEKNLLSYARKYENSEFILIIPPFSLAKAAIFLQSKKDKNLMQKAVIKYILNENLKNVKIYAFDNIGFNARIENYRDLDHYSHEINSQMLNFIANNTGLLTKNNFEAYWQEYENKALEFDLEGFRDTLNTMLGKK